MSSGCRRQQGGGVGEVGENPAVSGLLMKVPLSGEDDKCIRGEEETTKVTRGWHTQGVQIKVFLLPLNHYRGVFFAFQSAFSKSRLFRI